jgi:zona occludens toxin (predicted ATPase)
MASVRWLRVLVPVFLSLLFFVTACSPQTPSRYSQVQEETTGRNAPAAVSKEAEQGSTFNKFFPGSTGSYSVVPSQEKRGFAEYKINQDSKNVAMLSINDTISNPTAAEKFQNSTETISGYPAVDQGANATALLVNGRYQVKVQSRDASFTRENRVDWLQKFDLQGLAALDPAPSASLPQKAARRFPQLQKATDPKAKIAPTLVPQPAT